MHTGVEGPSRGREELLDAAQTLDLKLVRTLLDHLLLERVVEGARVEQQRPVRQEVLALPHFAQVGARRAAHADRPRAQVHQAVAVADDVREEARHVRLERVEDASAQCVHVAQHVRPRDRAVEIGHDELVVVPPQVQAGLE